jgi:hypothetical protein
MYITKLIGFIYFSLGIILLFEIFNIYKLIPRKLQKYEDLLKENESVEVRIKYEKLKAAHMRLIKFKHIRLILWSGVLILLIQGILDLYSAYY